MPIFELNTMQNILNNGVTFMYLFKSDKYSQPVIDWSINICLSKWTFLNKFTIVANYELKNNS